MVRAMWSWKLDRKKTEDIGQVLSLGEAVERMSKANNVQWDG